MNIKPLGSAVFILFLITGSIAQTQKTPRLIIFPRDSIVARSAGYLRGQQDSASFVMHISAGQHVRIEIHGAGSTRGALIYPSGKQDGQPGGVVFDDTVDETGDYKLVVNQSLMAEPWRGRFQVMIEILPAGQAIPEAHTYAQYVGKYPSELFQSVPAVKSRARQLFGASFKSFTDRMQVETSITRNIDAIVLRGCKPHLCTIDEAILMVDLNDGKVYGALKFNGKFRVFKGDRAEMPAVLKREMARKP